MARTSFSRSSGSRRFCYRRRAWFWAGGGFAAGRLVRKLPRLPALGCSCFRCPRCFRCGMSGMCVARFVTALFMTTRFSFSGAHAWASGPNGPIGKVERLGILQKAQARWHAWREEREQQRMRRRVEESRLSGRKPVPPQSIGKAEILNEPPKTIRLGDESSIFKGNSEIEEGGEKETKDGPHKTPIFFLNRESEKAPARKAGDPKIAKGSPNTNFLRLPCCVRANAARSSMKTS